MNKERRAELYEVIESLDEATDQLRDIVSEEEDSFDNLLPGLQESKTGDGIQDAISKLGDFVTEIENVRDKIEKMAKGKK